MDKTSSYTTYAHHFPSLTHDVEFDNIMAYDVTNEDDFLPHEEDEMLNNYDKSNSYSDSESKHDLEIGLVPDSPYTLASILGRNKTLASHLSLPMRKHNEDEMYKGGLRIEDVAKISYDIEVPETKGDAVELANHSDAASENDEPMHSNRNSRVYSQSSWRTSMYSEASGLDSDAELDHAKPADCMTQSVQSLADELQEADPSIELPSGKDSIMSASLMMQNSMESSLSNNMVDLPRSTVRWEDLGTPDEIGPPALQETIREYNCVALISPTSDGPPHTYEDGEDEEEQEHTPTQQEEHHDGGLPGTSSSRSSTQEANLCNNSINSHISCHPEKILELKCGYNTVNLDEDTDHTTGTFIKSDAKECFTKSKLSSAENQSIETDQNDVLQRILSKTSISELIAREASLSEKGSDSKNDKSCKSSTHSSPFKSRTTTPPRSLSPFDCSDLEASHRGCHKFIPRHFDELEIEIGDPIYVSLEADDLWCEGINLRTGKRGIFPSAYATDLNFLEEDVDKLACFSVHFLGSVEVKQAKGLDVICQAIHKVAFTHSLALQGKIPPMCKLEINEYGIKMTDKPKKGAVSSGNDEKSTFFSLKNISYCGYHPRNEKYFAFVTKHPVDSRFACHVFVSEISTKQISKSVSDAFQKFYQQYLAFVHPTEDIYID